MKISQEAFDLIVAEEVSSEATYKKKYTRPEWPGEASGVTIGIGYDCGYSNPTRLYKDWDGRIPDETIEALVPACGVKGTAARDLTKKLQSSVNVPWESAIREFKEVEIPRWEDGVLKALPNADKLSPDCLGALVSLSYNRGFSYHLAGDRYVEMRQIKDAMENEKYEDIPEYLERMKRIWPTVKGLRDRRDREAALFRRGLSAINSPEDGPTEPTGEFKSEEGTQDTSDIAENLKSQWDKWSWLKELKDINFSAFARQAGIILTGTLSFLSDHKGIFITAVCMIAAYALWNALGRPNPFRKK